MSAQQAIIASGSPSPPVEVETISPRSRPTIIQYIKHNPNSLIYLLVLLCLLAGDIAGWAIFSIRTKGVAVAGSVAPDPTDTDGQDDGKEGERGNGQTAVMISHAGFSILALLILGLLIRHLRHLDLTIFQKSRIANTTQEPPSDQRPMSDPAARPPSWLLPNLPTYVDAVGGRGQGTGNVEDRWIVGEKLPKYGDNRGSRLLLQSASRGGSVVSVIFINAEEDPRDSTAVRDDQQGSGSRIITLPAT